MDRLFYITSRNSLFFVESKSGGRATARYTYERDVIFIDGERKKRNVNRNRLLRIFAIITAIGAYVMLLLGALVTGTGSGQGCGNSWPFCQGQVIPLAPSLATVVEY